MSEHFEMSVWQELNRIANALEKISKQLEPPVYVNGGLNEEEVRKYLEEENVILLKADSQEGEK